MRKSYVLAILLLALTCLRGVTAKQILDSKDVIAYTYEAGLFLMDVNTGAEVKVDTSEPVSQILWDKDGKRFYYSFVPENSDTESEKFTLYELLLPSLQEVELTSLSLEDEVTDDVTIKLGFDGKIYIGGYKWAWLADGTQYKTNLQTFGSFDPKTAEYTEISEPKVFKAEYYKPELLKQVTSEGYGITNQMVDDRENPHFELFHVLSKGEEKPEYRQLTDFGPAQPNLNLKPQPIEFIVSPDDNVVVYSYSYYANNPKEELGYTCATSQDGARKTFLTNLHNVTQDNLFAWTKDSRLVFCREVDKMKGGEELCILEKDFTIRVLKPLGDYDIPTIYYRY